MLNPNAPFLFSTSFNFMTDGLWIKNKNAVGGATPPPPAGTIFTFANGNNFTFANGNTFVFN